MTYTKEQVEEILKANGLVIRSIYLENMTPDDFTHDEIVTGTLEEANNPQIEKEFEE